MKKLMVVTHKMSGGGCERVIAQLLTCFAREGIDCTLVTECGVPSFYDLPESVRQIYLTFDNTLRSSRIPRAYAKLRKLVKQEGDSRLRRRLLAIEKLDVVEKRQVLQLLDAFIERDQLKRKVESRA